MIMVVIMVVIMMLVDVGARREAVIGLDRSFQLLAAHRAIADLGPGEQEVDDLVLVQRGAQLSSRHRILLDVLDEALLVLRLILRGRLGDEALHLGLGHFDAIVLANLRQEQAEAHAALGDRAIIVAIVLELGLGGFRIGLVSGFMLELLPDLGELGLDHRRRNREVMTIGEMVEQLALHVGASEAVELLLDLALDQLLELVEALQAKLLGELVVDHGVGRNLHFGDGDGEHGVLAGQVLGRIVLREGDVEIAALAGLHAFELLLEARDQAARAELDRHALTGSTLEGDAVDRALIVHDNQIALDRGMTLGSGFVTFGLGGDALDLGVDLGVAGGHRKALQRDALDLRSRHVGQHFERDAELGVLAFRIVLVEVDGGLGRGTQLLLGEQGLDAVLHRAVERVLVQRRAVHLLHDVRGHLAGAEARHPHLRGNLLHLLLDPRGDILGRDRELVSALQPLVQRLDSLHGQPSFPEFSCNGTCPVAVGAGAGEGTRTPTSCDTGT